MARKAGEDDVGGHAAKLAYFAVLALFPMLLFITTVLGIVLRQHADTHQAVRDYVLKAAPPSAASVITGTLDQVSTKSGGGKLVVGLLGWLWAASSGMIAVMRSLNVVYGIQERRTWFKTRAVAVLLTLGFALLVIAATSMLAAGGPIAERIASVMGLGGSARLVWNIVRWPIALALILLAFNLIYKQAPNVTHNRWHWLMPGTVCGVALWLAASFGFTTYLQHFNRYSSTYGSIAGVIILLLWLYLSANTLLLGAEVNAVTEREARTVAEKKG